VSNHTNLILPKQFSIKYPAYPGASTGAILDVNKTPSTTVLPRPTEFQVVSGGYNTALFTDPKRTGKFVVEIQLLTTSSSNGTGIGLCKSDHSLTDYMGHNSESIIAWWPTWGVYKTPGGNVSSAPNLGAFTSMVLAIDLTGTYPVLHWVRGTENSINFSYTYDGINTLEDDVYLAVSGSPGDHTLTNTGDGTWINPHIAELFPDYTLGWPAKVLEIPIYFTPVSGGTTTAPVQNALNLDWNMVSSVANNRALIWNLLNPVTSTIRVDWDLLQTALKSADFNWSLVESINNSTQIDWDLLSVVGNSNNFDWSLLESVESSKSYQWDLIEHISNDVNAVWDLLAAVSNTTQIDWDLLHSVITNTAFEWSSLNSVTGETQIDWDVLSSLASVTNSTQIDWNMLKLISNTVDLDWSLLQTTENGTDLRWSLLNQINQSLKIDWDLLVKVDSTIQLDWDLLSNLASVSNGVQFRWSLIAQVSSQLAAQWDLLESVGVSLSMLWNLSTAVATQIETQWDLLVKTESNIELTWDSIATTENGLVLNWNLQQDTIQIPINLMIVTDENRTVYILPENRNMKILH